MLEFVMIAGIHNKTCRSEKCLKKVWKKILITGAMVILMWPLGIDTCIYPWQYHRYQCFVYRPIYTCDIGLSTGQYFEIDNELQVKSIFVKKLCSADISISRMILFVSFCESLVSVSASIDRYRSNIALLVMPVIPALFGSYLQFENPRYSKYYQYISNFTKKFNWW